MSDRDHIEAAYAITIQKQFEVLLEAYSVAAGDAGAESRANAKFVAGVAFRRRVLEVAIRLSNQPPFGPRLVKHSAAGSRKRK